MNLVCEPLMCKQVNQEVDDMYAEFQREKEDLLESIRMLQDQMQLKDMVIEAFIPPEETQKVWTGKSAHYVNLCRLPSRS
jgi:hypothetical protein